MDHLLTNQEAAELLGVSRASFYRIARRHLPGVREGRHHVKFDRRDVEAFAESRKESNDEE